MLLFGALAGCAAVLPRAVPPTITAANTAVVPGIPSARYWGDQAPPAGPLNLTQVMPNLHRHAYAIGPGGKPEVNILALSGGGSDGAFGAGLLKGWTERGDRPVFHVVTGVSAGALIAPFAYLGSAYDSKLEQIWTEYETNELVIAQILPAIFGGPALADTTPLEKLIERYVDRRMLNAVAREYRNGRMLLIGTTNLDSQRPVVWNMGEIAASSHPEAIVLFRKVLMASAAIPGAFPPVNIGVDAAGARVEEMHVDGGVTREVFVAPVQLNLHRFDAFYPSPPLRRIFIVKNGKLAPEFQAVKPTAIAIGARSVSTLIKAQNHSDIYRIYRQAVESQAEFRLTAVPESFSAKPKEAFDSAYQRDLFETGRAMGRDGGNWTRVPPELKR